MSLSYPTGTNPLIYELILFYPSRSMTAMYLGEQKPELSWLTSGLMQLCPFQNTEGNIENSVIWIEVWHPENSIQFNDWYRDRFGHPSDFPINFFKLSEASFINEKEFYEIY